jgi:PAS domain S-box-containing protein
VTAIETTKESATSEVKELKACINDLVSALALPAIWSGGEPHQIVGALLDVLLGMLRVDFVYAVTKNASPGSESIEMIRFAEPENPDITAYAMGQLLKPWLQHDDCNTSVIVQNLIGEDDISIATTRLGLQNELGWLVAGSRRDNFPNATERLLLGVATNQAAIGLQEARFLFKQKRIAAELEQQVAQRTKELAAANEELKREIAERRKSEIELRTTINAIPAQVWSNDPNSSAVFQNQTYLKYAGLTAEALSGSDWQNTIHPDDAGTYVKKWLEIAASGLPGEAEARFRRFDGEYRWFLMRCVPVRDEQGKVIKWYGVNTDIDDWKRAESILRLNEAYMAEAQKLSRTGSFGWNVVSRRINWSEEAYRIWNLDPSVEPTLEFMYQRVHPDDLAHFKQILETGRHEGKDSEFEFRMRMPDHSIKHMHVVRRAMRDESGQIIELVGAIKDVTAEKEAFRQIQDLKDQLQRENVALREEVDAASMFEEIVGTSPALQAVLSRVSKVAPTDSTVLITGETGTGKELIARAIHKRSDRADGPFVSVNCASIPQSLIASELFGHEKGAFTGALQRRLGRFELAKGGTLFLDEAGELPAETQIALLTVLQDREFERVGGTQSIRADVRLIAATNRNLEVEIANGTFRSDLFYRLNVFPIEMPALRARREDIAMLTEYFIHRYAGEMGKKISSISKKTLDLFQAYNWPGNIRELQNIVERSLIVCETEIFSVDESWLAREPHYVDNGTQPLAKRMMNGEKEIIEAALIETKGRVSGPTGAAAKLGMPASTLESKIRVLNINKHQFKTG